MRDLRADESEGETKDGNGGTVETKGDCGVGEGECYDEEGLLRLLRLARIGCGEIFGAQLKAVGR